MNGTRLLERETARPRSTGHGSRKPHGEESDSVSRQHSVTGRERVSIVIWVKRLILSGQLRIRANVSAGSGKAANGPHG